MTVVMSTPNLYSFATKELAQDATIAYILAWADPGYCETHPSLHRLGTALLRTLLATRMDESDIPSVRSINVEVQVDRIDVLARINDQDEDGLLLLIEDKVDTHEHSNQIQRYIDTATQRFPECILVPVYMKTGNASLAALPDESVCGRFLRKDMLGVLDRFPDTADTIVDNFREHLLCREEEFRAFQTRPVPQWNSDSYQGYYSELESRMSGDKNWSLSEWNYTPNPAGGLLYYCFGWNTVQWDGQTIHIYLQIEDATRLTLRLGNWEGYRIAAPLMYATLHHAQELTKEDGSLRISKAGRFKGGKSAAVAEVTFNGTDGYIAVDDRGIMEIKPTMERLKRAREFVTTVHDRWRITETARP